MKHENIDKDIKNAKLSLVINMVLRIICIFLLMSHYEQLYFNQLAIVVIWCVVILFSVQCLLLPYLTNMRIKEIKKGEIYEASKY